MKKVFCAVLALAVSGAAVSCNEKKKPEPKEEDIPAMTDSFGDYAQNDTKETEFTELSAGDFKTINVAVKETEGGSPVSVERIDLSNVAVEEKVPLCYKAENVEKYVNDHNTYYYYDQQNDITRVVYSEIGAEMGGTPVYDWHDFLDKPVKGHISGGYLRGKDCFVYVMYDVPIGASCYDHAVFRYDTESGRTEEIYSWSAKDLNETADGNCLFTEDAVFLVYYDIVQEKEPRSIRSAVKRLELDTKKLTTVFEGSNYISGTSFICEEDGGVYFNNYENTDSGQEAVNVYKYNEESGKFEKFAENDVSGDVKSSIISNGRRYSLVKPEGKRKLCLVCDNYRIGTDVTNASIVCADDNCFVLQNEEQLNVYNIVKKEHYVLDVGSLGYRAVMSDGKIFIGLGDGSVKKPVYCIIPELGLTYRIVESGFYDNIRCINGKVFFNGKHMETAEYRTNDGQNSINHQFDVIDSIYAVNVSH